MLQELEKTKHMRTAYCLTEGELKAELANLTTTIRSALSSGQSLWDPTIKFIRSKRYNRTVTATEMA